MIIIKMNVIIVLFEFSLTNSNNSLCTSEIRYKFIRFILKLQKVTLRMKTIHNRGIL